MSLFLSALCLRNLNKETDLIVNKDKKINVKLNLNGLFKKKKRQGVEKKKDKKRILVHLFYLYIVLFTNLYVLTFGGGVTNR